MQANAVEVMTCSAEVVRRSAEPSCRSRKAAVQDSAPASRDGDVLRAASILSSYDAHPSSSDSEVNSHRDDPAISSLEVTVGAVDLACIGGEVDGTRADVKARDADLAGVLTEVAIRGAVRARNNAEV